MSEKYIDLADRIMAATATTPNTTRASAIGDTLEWLDSNFDHVPGRTITESELREVAGRLFARWPDLGVFMGRLQRELSELGITHTPDPEPTETERLAWLIDGHINPDGITPESLAEYLVAHGVKAPGGDDD